MEQNASANMSLVQAIIRHGWRQPANRCARYPCWRTIAESSGRVASSQRDCVNLKDSAYEHGFSEPLHPGAAKCCKDRRRDLPITEDMAAVLVKLMAASKCEYVFTSLHDHSAPLSANTLEISTEALKRSCEFHPDAGIHALRHTFLTEAGRHTQNVKALQKLAGHSKD